MTLEELRTDILAPVLANNITYDSRLLEPDYVDYLIHQYRSKEIGDNYQRNGDIHSTWIQPYIPKKVEKVDKAQYPFVDVDKDFGKINLPRIVQFKKRDMSQLNKGVYSVINPTSQSRYYQISYERYLSYRNSSLEESKKLHFFIIGDDAYIEKIPSKIYFNIIAYNPLEAHIIDNVAKLNHNLIIGNEYELRYGTITHNGVSYEAPAIFTAVVEEFQGSGMVYSKEIYRPLTDKDPYPFSDNQCENIKSKIWQREFNLTLNTTKDEVGNANEENSKKGGRPNLSVSESE